ncbi:CU044_5270 family protein [Actinomadura graeca]|uniref:CU044_5270 family protein n=1 Tax=Actinomadura graeca TaxID=2750812 RepID=A0ABX8R1D7_9ACTN|nr:CU044_5270 family protein [Actinomadura graeca]QXJ22808.1 CU044_5270 family protein [Actinomadura graeca]
MDELQMIATLLDEEPSGEAAAAGRRRLTAEIRDRRRRPALPRLPLFGGIGVAAAAAGVAGVLLLSSGTSPRAPDPVEARPMSAQAVLLSAAKQAEAAPATGRYWHLRTLMSRPVQVGPKGNRYWVDKRSVTETWTLRSGRSASGFRDVGARPSTQADAAAWKRDGSPTSWDLGRGDTVDGAHIIVHSGPRPGEVNKVTGPGTFTVCDKEMSFAQVRALPAEPAALKDAVVDAMRNNDDGPVPAAARNGFVQQCLAGLLADVPAAPKVRGAAYRALATMPAVKVIGRTTDERGRKGIGLVLQSGDRGPVTRLVIDPRTSLVLSASVAQTGELAKLRSKSGTTVYLQVGWTDDGPRVPALP